MSQWLKGVCPAIMRTSIWVPTSTSKLDTKKENLNSALENDKRKETENKKVYIRPPVTHKHHRKGKREKQEKKPQVLLEVIAQRRVASAPPCVVWSSPTVAHSQPSEFFRCSGFPLGCLLILVCQFGNRGCGDKLLFDLSTQQG